MIDLRNKVEEAMKRLGQNLRVAREASHRSQEEVASAAKIGRSTLVHIESGKGASLSKIMAIANVLTAEVGLSNGEASLTARRLARLEQGAKVQSIREAHLRLAVRMLGDAAAGKLLVEDARKAVGEVGRRGIFTYCISLDRQADAYVSDIFGQRYSVIDRVERLPERLPELFLALTR